MPGDATETANKSIDVDADGAPDVVRTYSVGAAPVAGDWHLRVELATGQGVDLALPDDPAPGAVVVLGASYIGSDVEPGPGGFAPAIFVKTGAGASTSIISLFRLDECTLVAMGGGTPFPVGAAATHSESLRCEGVAGTMLLDVPPGAAQRRWRHLRGDRHGVHPRRRRPRRVRRRPADDQLSRRCRR